MEKSGLFKYYESLPTWSKGVLLVAGLAGLGLIGFAVYKKVKSVKELADSKETANTSEDEYKKLLKQGYRLSFPETNYFSSANTIATSLKGCETYFGEEDASAAVLRVVKKPIDWYFLVKTFGSKEIEDCMFGKTAYALPELLTQQLGSLSPSAYYLKTNLAVLQENLKKIGIIL